MRNKILYIFSQIAVLVITTYVTCLTFGVSYNTWALYAGYGAVLISPLILSRKNKSLFKYYFALTVVFVFGVIFQTASEWYQIKDSNFWSGLASSTVYSCFFVYLLFQGRDLMAWLSLSTAIIGAIGLQLYGNDKLPYMYGLSTNLIFFAMASLPILRLLDSHDDGTQKEKVDLVSSRFEQRAA